MLRRCSGVAAIHDDLRHVGEPDRRRPDLFRALQQAERLRASDSEAALEAPDDRPVLAPDVLLVAMGHLQQEDRGCGLDLDVRHVALVVLPERCPPLQVSLDSLPEMHLSSGPAFSRPDPSKGRTPSSTD
jgi:hypothetical protein